MHRGFSVAIGAALFGLAHTAALAVEVEIVGLVNTGVGTGGGLLADGWQDNNYSLSASGSTATITNGKGWAQTSAGGWPISPFAPKGPWLEDNDDSRWLTPQENAAASFDPSSNGTYIWTLTFNLSGYVASTAFFSAQRNVSMTLRHPGTLI